MENADLKYIKKHYSEKMAHLCRELFSTILETESLLPSILDSTFAHSSSLAIDLINQDKLSDFRSFINSYIESKEERAQTLKTPEELLDEAGYILYPECKTEKDIQSFKHYFAKGEELCTFNGGRLNNCRVWFAVKKNVDQILRKNFFNPQRQDEYGTSVISIQFSKGAENWLSIKNRYNHTVSNPDSTFLNNLDNIIYGLTDAFVKSYGLNLSLGQSHGFELDGYVVANDGKSYKYNYEIDGIYYCENNTIIENGTPIKYDPSRYMVIDYFIVDMAKDSLSITSKYKDSFANSFGQIQYVCVERDENKNKVVRFKVKNGEDILVTLNKNNQIIKLDNKNATSVADSFLIKNTTLTEIYMPALKTVGDRFLLSNKELKELSLPSLELAGDEFLKRNETITKINIPSLNIAGDRFLFKNNSLCELNAPLLEYIGTDCMLHNNSLTKIKLPLLKSVGGDFISSNQRIYDLELPMLSSVGLRFLCSDLALKKLNLPKLKDAGHSFLASNVNISEANLPNLVKTGYGFLYLNNCLKELNLPMLESVGGSFLSDNETIERVNLPKLTEVGGRFLYKNNLIEHLSLPNVTCVGDHFMCDNNSLKSLYMPKLNAISDYFLYNNQTLNEINLESLSNTVRQSLKDKSFGFLFFHPKRLKIIKRNYYSKTNSAELCR